MPRYKVNVFDSEHHLVLTLFGIAAESPAEASTIAMQGLLTTEVDEEPAEWYDDDNDVRVVAADDEHARRQAELFEAARALGRVTHPNGEYYDGDCTGELVYDAATGAYLGVCGGYDAETGKFEVLDAGPFDTPTLYAPDAVRLI